MPIAQSRLESLQICKLLQVVREEDKEQIKKLVQNGVPHLINYNEPQGGTTAMIIAAIANNDAMIDYLLDLGGHPDVVDFKGRTAAMHAAEHGHVQSLEKLANAGADMKIRDLDGKGILFYCISSTQRHAKCIEIALEFEAEVDNKARDGRPVFFAACETSSENEDVCLQLLANGADPNGKHEASGRTALMMASGSGSAKTVRAIVQKNGEVNVLDKKKSHAVHCAAKGGFLDILVILHAYGADFDQTDDKGNTPVHFAANGHGMCCKFLGQRGANPKPKNNDGEVPRAIAKDNGHKDCVKEIRKVEKSFGKSGKNNEPWALALYDWSVERASELLEYFAKYDPDNETGYVSQDDFMDGLKNMDAPIEEDTIGKVLSVHDKKKDGNVEYNEFLSGKKYVNKLYLMSAMEGKKKKKKKGGKKGKKGKTKIPFPICTAPEGIRNEDGGPPDNFIERNANFTDTGRFERDLPPQHPLQDDSAWYLQAPERVYININDSARNGDLDSLKLAFEKGIHVDTRDKYYKTPLMAAAGAGNIDVVKFLLNNGAIVNARDNFKWTPLHHACHAGMLDIVQLLLENGADLDPVALNGGTPLVRAIESSRLDLVQFLIEKGAKIQIENKKGHTPLDVALSYADPRVLDVVQNKWDSLPPMGDKKGKGKGKGKGSAKKRPASSGKGDSLQPILCARVRSPVDELERLRKGSILRAASALAGGIEEREDITYSPRRAWLHQPTTQDLIKEKEIKRERFTYEVDFPDFEMPFKKNVSEKVVVLGGLDGDD